MAREGDRSHGEEESVVTARDRRTVVRGRMERGFLLALISSGEGGGDSGSGTLEEPSRSAVAST